MLIKCFGLFWRRDEINWFPGSGRPKRFRLLGRTGANRGSIRIADFREQKGIYILYGNFGPYYVGLTRDQDIGRRLKDHCGDDHAGRWDRFSWFGFRDVLGAVDGEGVHRLRNMASMRAGRPFDVITDVEALLIRSMGLRNINQNNFVDAYEWTQIKLDEIDKYLNRI